MTNIEGLIKMIYRFWRNKNKQADSACPDEETLACFSEGKLSNNESKMVKEHLVICARCSEVTSLLLEKFQDTREVPEFLIDKAKSLAGKKSPISIMEVILAVKEKALQIMGTSADVILDNEIVPMPVLRSRHITDFSEEIKLIKESKNIKINLLIQKKDKDRVRVSLNLVDKVNLKPLSDMRLTLIKDNKEIESYEAIAGNVVFDNLTLGRYAIQISSKEEDLGTINLDIK